MLLFYMKVRVRITVVLIFIILIPSVLAQAIIQIGGLKIVVVPPNKNPDTVSIISEIFEDKIRTTTQVTYTHEEKIRCSYSFATGDFNESDFTDIQVKLNGQDSQFISVELYSQMEKVTDLPIHTFYDPCNYGSSIQESYKSWYYESCGDEIEREGIRNTLLISSNLNSSTCDFEIIQDNIEAKHSTTKLGLLKKEFSTKFIPIKANTFIYKIILPKDSKIKSNNLEEHIVFKQDNEIKWVIKDGTGNELEIFKVTYKTPLFTWLRKKLDNNDTLQTLLIILALFGIIDIYKRINKFYPKIKKLKGT